jgi:hypothetical protein
LRRKLAGQLARLEAMGLPGAQSLLGLLKATDGMEMDALAPVTGGDHWRVRMGLCVRW